MSIHRYHEKNVLCFKYVPLTLDQLSFLKYEIFLQTFSTRKSSTIKGEPKIKLVKPNKYYFLLFNKTLCFDYKSN